MKAIMVMYDSLNRRMLEPYGCDWVHTPNFGRLAGKTVTFDNCYVGSMPCMPARREIHTGRHSFLHRSWGPLEPFDDSMPEILKQHGVYTHLASDHYHYWEDGGATYHNRYSSWEFARGQEGDFWKGHVKDPEMPESLNSAYHPWSRQDRINRSHMPEEKDHPQAQTFDMGLEFISTNHDADNWFLTIECFDPHEPYFSPQRYKDLYPHEYDGPLFDWPSYRRVEEIPEQVRHLRYENAALHSMCDAYLGKVLDAMDEYGLWDDTLLIVCTDHGFLLGEHGWWAKCVQPFYNEIAHTPLFVWDPRTGMQGERCAQLVQTIDFAPTLLEFFGVDAPKDVQGIPLRDAMTSDSPVREAALFGIHGGHVNCTDGRYVYMRAPVNSETVPLYEYTMMPTHMRGLFPTTQMQTIDLGGPFDFTKGCRTMRIDALSSLWKTPFETMLFDLETDPGQENPIQDPKVERRMIAHLTRLMRENDAPQELFDRLGL